MIETLEKKALKANGNSRSCTKCSFYNYCMRDNLIEICSKGFIEGYMKGYRRALKDIKDKG